jgi:general secretion pathway protein I
LSRRRPETAREQIAGFTLIEVLIALAVTAIALAAIGGLMAANIRGTNKVNQHLGLVQALWAIESELENRATLVPGVRSGEREGVFWSIEIVPYLVGRDDQGRPPPFLPQLVHIRLRSISGDVLETETIRLTKPRAQ